MVFEVIHGSVRVDGYPFLGILETDDMLRTVGCHSTVSCRKTGSVLKGSGLFTLTFAKEFLPKETKCPTFVKADLIAAGLAPFEPEPVAFQAVD